VIPNTSGGRVQRFAAAAAIAAALAFLGACSRNNQITAPGPTVTLTGCLQPGDIRDTYRLTASGAPTGPLGTRGVGQPSEGSNPTGTAARSRTADEGAFDTRLYTVVAGKNVNLAIYQGALVKVTGSVEQGDDAKVTGLGGSSQNPPPPTDMQSQQGSSNAAGGTANATTGQGPQSSVLGPAPNRPAHTIRVARVERVSVDCGSTK
jgi:hypothetical protein